MLQAFDIPGQLYSQDLQYSTRIAVPLRKYTSVYSNITALRKEDRIIYGPPDVWIFDRKELEGCVLDYSEIWGGLY